MGHYGECSGHDLTDARFGLTDVGFGLRGEKPKCQFQVQREVGLWVLGSDFWVSVYRCFRMQFAATFVILSNAKNLLWVGILQTLRVFRMTGLIQKPNHLNAKSVL